jgi:excisionase family DNA binding protein
MQESAMLLRPDEAARMLSIGRSKLYELLSTNVLPTVRIGKSVRVPRAALEKWIEEQTGQGVRVPPADVAIR